MELKKGDKIVTVYGETKIVMSVWDTMVTTYSGMTHISKIVKVIR